jgi:glycosyltransferase involved in cell wall biosynthesis
VRGSTERRGGARMTARPRVTLLRGHHANVWDLRPWELLADEFDVGVLVTGSNLHQVDGLELETVSVRTPRDLLPASRVTGPLAYAIGERYLGLEELLAGSDVVHAAEIGTWYSAQAARLKQPGGYRLALTVWETIAWRGAYRWPRERRYRSATMAAADLLLPTTERARGALRLEGAPAERCVVCPPGIDLARFAVERRPPADGRHRVLSAGRLVWEKGHQDVLRAFAALRAERDDVDLLVVGSGPEERKLERYAEELGVADAVEFRPTVPYEEMPALYGSASALVLASLPTRGWEEQFGMVLIEALAGRTPVIASSSGAIPEVVEDDATLFTPGDWEGIARALAEGPLARPPATPGANDPARLERYSTGAAAERYRSVYRRLLGR